jgi:Ca2+-binding RTX toxin-like protein
MRYMRMDSQPLRGGVLLGFVLMLLVAGPAFAQAPGLPRTYDSTRIDSPNPRPNGAFGWGIVSAELTGDGVQDLLVAQSQSGPGQIFIFDGASGQHIDTINPPEKNPNNTNDEVLGFVYVETMPDVGSCPGGDGSDADRICDATTVAPGDGVPEIIVGSRNLRVNANGASPPVATDPNVGRGYVFDGATRAVLKRIDMPPGERAGQGGAQFARVMISPQAMPPCAGSRRENNDMGVGRCPDLPAEVRIGDLNGGGQPDIIITARNYRETGAQAAPGSQCRTANATNPPCTSGKAWAYAGEAISGSNPQAILETPIYPVQNPHSQTTGSGDYGGVVFRLGDVTGDNRPEFVIPARNLDYPLAAPDAATWPDVGASYIYNGATGDLLVQSGSIPSGTIVSPEPQPRSQFGGSFNAGRATGDLGATTAPDLLQGAPLQNAHSTDDGKLWAINGVFGGGGGEQSWNFATLSDPTPHLGGNFGGSTTGAGDLVEGLDAPANEVLVGGFGPFDPNTQASNNIVTDLHFMNATMQTNLQTIPHPEQVRGDGFGVGLAPMGDMNDDGFLDFAASAYRANRVEAGEGRAYIFRSNNSPAPPLASEAPAAVRTPAGLRAGRCTNDTLGTDRDDRLDGTIAGDRMAGFGGRDVIRGFQSGDCLHGGPGRDRLVGGAENDELLGGDARDRLLGGEGRDQLFGMRGSDRLTGSVRGDLLAGGSGNDVLNGGFHGDRLFGEHGNDRIIVGTGRNIVDAGPGNDVVFSRNGKRDNIVCGRGHDRVAADRFDLVNGCERVRRARRR